jgi:hypothetical protein
VRESPETADDVAVLLGIAEVVRPRRLNESHGSFLIGDVFAVR